MIDHRLDLGKQLKKYSALMKGASAKLKNAMKRNAEKACESAERAIKEKTPHPGDGKPRGQNVINGALQQAWKVRFETGSSNVFGIVVITNEKPYAKYVQEGHRVAKHFVPWLYKDGSVLSREINHEQSLFGLVVGVKTTYVKGIDMVGAGVKAFNKTFGELNQKLFEKVLKGGGK